MIEVKNLTKSFGDKTVLQDISGTFEQGKTNLIIGASGSGKSVMLKNIVGLFKPDSGEILYNGRNFVNADRDTKTDIRREIGMLFQGGALFDSMNVEQNVKFPLDVLTKMPEDEKLDRVNTMLKKVKLENTNKRMPSEISGGMQKRVGIARALVNSSKYLFCDEPNSGLDPMTSIKIDQLLAEITDEYQITTVIVTHDMNSVMEIGEYILFISNSKKLWEGTSSDIIHSGVQELDEFVFANKLMRKVKAMNG
ncbi:MULTISPECIES: ATP-binding cassette domain-containing protein [Roseivirga]|jgi:phospholipid/cholesterol/gamma-HCH transport system ATP-binding protein|uniref:ABC transporter ATP-binding protein n=1 Tax=Roseivirga spongicola TaxID=333140 RepID=A0A150XBG1_9BACT|nr:MULTISPECIES: ATP-binding cassette domain-containing protein [Roseivirga]KYG76065.1 ABC transporter ATP-binding protein [Roseivirga spongicola]MBO6494281.1 ATP-binding cassette domain-containing protein [Roseivirga sp.]PWL24585.1 MAG: ABC transporter ATP-binding protein [Roseivirga sp. XM-24bin3]WPZ10358.1 ATP-binding cassette domain-containing protein [Roseivirga spongicola]